MSNVVKLHQDPAPTAATRYDIRISEAQRHYLLVALNQCLLQGCYGADEEGRQEIEDLHGMLADGLVPLVDPNRDHPENTTNDFNL